MTRRSPLRARSANVQLAQPSSPPDSAISTRSHKRRRDDAHDTSIPPPSKSLKVGKTSSRRTARLSPSRIPPTSPASTRALWAAVYDSMSSERSTRSRSRASKANTAKTSSTITKPAAETILRPQDVHEFEQRVLWWHGITIKLQGGKRWTSESYFSQSREVMDVVGGNRLTSGFELVKIVLDDSKVEAICKAYQFMAGHRMREVDFSDFAKEEFFKVGEPFSFESRERSWNPRRMPEFRPSSTSGCRWLVPPFARPPVSDPPAQATCTWQLHPDVSYWLTTNGFNEQNRDQTADICFVYSSWLLSPYLTIEFKKDGDDAETARLQVAAAGGMALYNRWLLHRSTWEKIFRNNPTAQEPDTKHLAHFGITLAKWDFEIWVLSLNPDHSGTPPEPIPASGATSWPGCTMSKLGGGACISSQGVKILVHWVNHIHAWGLTDHAEGCRRDVLQYLEQDDIETSLGLMD